MELPTLSIFHHLCDIKTSSLFQRVVFAGLEAMSAKPISSLYKSACQKLPDSSASPQYTPRLNFEESQIAVVMLMMLGSNVQDQDEWPHLLVLISPHWIAKRSSPNYITYRRRTVYLLGLNGPTQLTQNILLTILKMFPICYCYMRTFA